MAQAVYKPLDLSSSQVRLLRLDPTVGDAGTPPQGSLDVVSLDENPEYVAISYEWSPPDQQNQSPIKMMVNGHELHVTPNMARALFCTQDSLHRSMSISRPTRFWIDALCINQEDEIERGKQVSMMRRIYEQASAVRAWLGEAEDNSDLAMSLLLELSRSLDLTDAIRSVAPTLLNNWIEESNTTRIKHQKAASIQMRAHNWARNLSTHLVYERAAQWVNERLENPAYGDRWAAVASLCSRSYWSRSWIIQELAVSSINSWKWQLSTRIYCGSRDVDLYSLLVVCAHIRKLPFFDLVCSETAIVLTQSMANVSWIASVWSLFRQGKTDLLNLLAGCGGFESSEPRDKVYSLLGLTKSYDGHQLDADYNIPTAEVLIRTAKHIILGSGNLELLLYCTKNRERISGLPTWVPDWTNFTALSRPRIHSKFADPWSARSSSYKIGEILENGTILQVSARLLGFIQRVTQGEDIPLAEDQRLESEARTAALLNTWIDFALSDLHLSDRYVVSDDKSLFTVVSVFHFLYETMFQNLDYEQGTKEWPFKDFVNWISSTRSQAPESSSLHLSWEQQAGFADCIGPDRCLFKYDGFSNLPKSDFVQALGTCWKDICPGDILAVVQGCQYPLVLRSIDDSRGDYIVITEAYVDGFMKGEALGIVPDVEINLH